MKSIEIFPIGILLRFQLLMPKCFHENTLEKELFPLMQCYRSGI